MNTLKKGTIREQGESGQLQAVNFAFFFIKYSIFLLSTVIDRKNGANEVLKNKNFWNVKGVGTLKFKLSNTETQNKLLWYASYFDKKKGW